MWSLLRTLALFACWSAALAESPFASDGRKATVLVFLMHDCPVANSMAPELARLSKEFGDKGVRFFGVYASESAAEIAAHRKDYALPFPGLQDANGVLAKRAGATRVPEAAVFSAAGELVYRGRINDRAVKLGVTRPVAKKHDLRLALEALLAGRKPEVKFTDVVGCYLPGASSR